MYRSLIFFLALLTARFTTKAQVPGLSRKQVPVLCYHQIRNWKAKDKQADKSYIIPPALFLAQMQMLSDSGYHPILPDELYAYLTAGKSLPSKPVMLTFDDTNADQFTAARPILSKYHFNAVYFIITGKIGTHKWFMDRRQIKQLAEEGNVIGCHTLDHTNFKKLKNAEFQTQIAGPKKYLEELTGYPVDYFAFPFGYWNRAGLVQLHKMGFKAAFQLDDQRDQQDPLMSLRRLIVPGYWSPQTLDKRIKTH